MVDFAEALRKAGEKKDAAAPSKDTGPVAGVRPNPLAEALASSRNKAATVSKENPLAAALAQKPTTQPQQPTQSPAIPAVVQTPTELVEEIVDTAITEMSEIINGIEVDDTPAPSVTAEDFNHPEQTDSYLPDDVKSFHEGFDILRSNFEYPDMIGQSIAHCMAMLQEKPHLKEHLREADAKALIEGLRIGYGNAIQIKQTKVTKKSAKAKEASDFAKELDALGGLGNIGDYVP